VYIVKIMLPTGGPNKHPFWDSGEHATHKWITFLRSPNGPVHENLLAAGPPLQLSFELRRRRALSLHVPRLPPAQADSIGERKVARRSFDWRWLGASALMATSRRGSVRARRSGRRRPWWLRWRRNGEAQAGNDEGAVVLPDHSLYFDRCSFHCA
jgi:hypothetical protein